MIYSFGFYFLKGMRISLSFKILFKLLRLLPAVGGRINSKGERKSGI